MKRNQRGFTLIEILVVLVVLAALMGLAIPSYINVVEKSRRQEALTALGAVKESSQRAYGTNGVYPTAVDFAQLDFDPNAQTAAGTQRHFNYGIVSGDQAFTVTATRNSWQFPAFGARACVIAIDQTGAVTITENDEDPPASTQA
ncbi:MAG: prepilin-type N-terminal cleavage/methylation domain-containing protein [Candidatus Omnitrophica bacterium]|nr:prepilin-type N-terminal cleavage/methylation domain-containing protein [Candidatus Omnitrophota bacterium]